jgi:hypothetical protein
LTPQFREVVGNLEQFRRFGKFKIDAEAEAAEDSEGTAKLSAGTKCDSRAQRSLRVMQTLARVFQLLRPFGTTATTISDLPVALPVEEATDGDAAGSVPLEWEVRWLSERDARFYLGLHEILTLELDGQAYAGVYTVRSFPVTHSEGFLSIRYTDAASHDRELGMIRTLNDWPVQTQELIGRPPNRRYPLRRAKGLVTAREDNGFVNCSAETDDGRVDITMQNNERSIKPFGYNGRLLTDLDQNHFLIPDLDLLPALQKRLFRQVFREF